MQKLKELLDFNLGEMILEMFTDWLKDLTSIFISFLEEVLFNYDGLSGYALKAYELFVYFGGLLLVVVALTKVISQMLSEGEGSQEADIWWTITQSVKSGGLLVIMPFAVSFTMKRIVQPIGLYFINGIGSLSMDGIEGIANSSDFKEAFDGTMSQLLLWLWILIVIAFFVIKMFVAQAQLLMNEILSPLVAVTVVNDEFNFVDVWWRDILSHIVTLITLTLSMLLFVEALAVDSALIWTKLPAIIGSGALVVTGPTFLKNLWFSSGAGRTGMGVGRTLMNYAIYRR